MFNCNQRRRATKLLSGFTLVETLLAVLMLSLVFSVFIDVIVRSIKVTKLSEQDVLAANLAFDGVELTRNRKDNAVSCDIEGTCSCWLSPFSSGNNACSMGSGFLGYFIPDDSSATVATLVGDTDFPMLSGNNVSNVPYLCRDAQQRVLNCTSGLTPIPGNFKRYISITKLDANRISVSSTVTWGAGNSYTASTLMFNVW